MIYPIGEHRKELKLGNPGLTNWAEPVPMMAVEAKELQPNALEEKEEFHTR